LTRATERLIDLWRGLVPVIVFDELHINRLIRSNAHKMERSTTLSDHLKIGSILGIIETAKWAIFNAETILPEVQNASLCRAGVKSAGSGVRNDLRGGIVSAEGHAAATESRRWR
jgi:hypothetical protein